MNKDALIARLPGWLHTHYGLAITAVSRIAAGTATDNFRATHPGGTVMVKAYRPGTDLLHEQRVLAVTASAAQAGLPLPRLYPSTTGALLHQAGGVAVSVWQWCDSDTPAGPLTANTAHETGKVLARLHLQLRRHDDGSWPVAQPHYRRHTLNQIRQRFMMLARHIGMLPEPTAADEVNLDRIAGRLAELRQVPGLLESATPPRYALVHGDFVRPNLLIHHGQLRAVIDMRLKVDEPVRELGRLAFDVHTVAASSAWLEVAEAALAGYLEEGGIVPAATFYGCARLALLHSLCSTYPIEDLYLDPPPAHLHTDLQQYWADRVAAAGQMIDRLDEIDAMVTRLSRLPHPPPPTAVAGPADPRMLLPVAATARAHLLDLIVQNAQTAGVKALLLWGSQAAGAADPLSDLDLIAVTDNTIEKPATLVGRLFEPAPLLFSRTVTHNGPEGGFYRGVCAQVAGLPIWADIYLWPAGAAVVPADTTVLFDHAGLPASPLPFWTLLQAQRAQRDGNPADEPASAELLSQLVAAKRLARNTFPAPDARPPTPAGSPPAMPSTSQHAAVQGIEAVDRWVHWCRRLAGTGWNREGWYTQVVRRTTKSTTAFLRSPQQPMVVKVLTGADPYQAGLFATETAVYQALAAEAAPVLAPRMLLSGNGYLAIAEVDATVLHRDRYPHEPLPAGQVHAALNALADFAGWAPATISRSTAAAQLQHTKAAGMLTAEEAATYQRLCGQHQRWRLAHGDAIPSNLLITGDGACTLIDFENTGWHLPGYDYAVLRSVLAAQPDTITGMIDQCAAEHAGENAYTINLIAAAAREVRLHTFFPPDPTGRREHVVNTAWAHARRRLRQHRTATTPTVSGASR